MKKAMFLITLLSTGQIFAGQTNYKGVVLSKYYSTENELIDCSVYFSKVVIKKIYFDQITVTETKKIELDSAILKLTTALDTLPKIHTQVKSDASVIYYSAVSFAYPTPQEMLFQAKYGVVTKVGDEVSKLVTIIDSVCQ
jgi:hypothetical protein